MDKRQRVCSRINMRMLYTTNGNLKNPIHEQKSEEKLRSLEADKQVLQTQNKSLSASTKEDSQEGKEREGDASVPAPENQVRALQQLVLCVRVRADIIYTTRMSRRSDPTLAHTRMHNRAHVSNARTLTFDMTYDRLEAGEQRPQDCPA